VIIQEEICDCPEFLIVDDNAFNIFTLSLILESHLPRSRYHSAFNGEEAVSLVRTRLSKQCGCGRRQYPIIFMDISMPVLDGYQASQQIREIEKSELKVFRLFILKV
jgi:CheY-like chemotaxis protein